MEEDTFLKPAVAGELARFVEARLFTDRPEKKAEYGVLQKKLVGRVSLPSFVVIDPRTGQKQEGGFNGMTLKEDVFAGFLRTYPGKPSGGGPH